MDRKIIMADDVKNAVDRLNQAVGKQQDLDTRARLCRAELEAILEKYDLEMAMQTVQINGTPQGWNWVFAERGKAPNRKPS